MVPAVAAEWVLDEGIPLDPFKLTRVGGLLYGRGTIDDKGSIAAVLYAMKAVKDSGLPVARTMRLMVETTEETGGDAMNYYQEQTPLPAYNIVLDSRYPAVVAEKGVGALRLSFARGDVGSPTDRATVTIARMSGAASATTIAQTATATLVSMDADALARRLTDASARFIDRYKGQGGPFQLGGRVAMAAPSRSGSPARRRTHRGPSQGVNPLPRLTLVPAEAAGPLAPNGYAQAVKAINELFGLDYLGHGHGPCVCG